MRMQGWSPAFIARIHLAPDVLARSPGHVSEHFSTGVEAMRATLAYLRPLPRAWVQRWLAQERGHLVIHPTRHGFQAGVQTFRGRALEDVAWMQLSLLIDDPIAYLTPFGMLMAHLIHWEERDKWQSQAWRDVARGVQSGFEAGYGRSEAAREQIDIYLAEGIAWYLVDRRALNIANPRLEKLLRSTLFRDDWYQAEGNEA